MNSDPEHIRRFNESIGRPSNEGDAFHEWFRSACLYFQRKYDPDVETQFRAVLGNVPIARLKQTWLEMLADPELKHMPRAGEILGRCRVRREQDVARRSPEPEHSPVDPERRLLNTMIHHVLVGTSLGIAEPPEDVPAHILQIAAICKQEHDNGLNVEETYQLGRRLLREGHA